MQAVKLFLAASKEEELAAEAFETKLREAAKRVQMDVEICPWYRDITFPPGKNYLSCLIDHCVGRDGVKASDFFAVILSDKEERASACLFELGLFLGALGFEPQRCFMLSARGDEPLPSPLKGYTHIPFTSPHDGTSPDDWVEAMREPANTVRTRMKALRAFAHAGFQVMNSDTLMDLEAPVGDSQTAELDDEAEVLVNRAQPIEEKQQPFAACVLYNMKRGVKYRYFFHDKQAFGSIARLLYALATVVPDSENPRKPGVGKIAQPAVIADHLKILQCQLSINLIPSPGPIEFCIHNVSNPGHARCFLRYPFSEKFIQWCDRVSAVHIARELTDLAIDENDLDHLFILRSTKQFDLNAPENQETKKRLWNAIRKRFADEKLNPLLKEVCFERLTEEEVRRWSQNPWDELGKFTTATV